MTLADVLQLAGNFGPMGLMVAYLIWRETRNEKLAKERVQADLEMVKVLTMMNATMEGLSRNVR